MKLSVDDVGTSINQNNENFFFGRFNVGHGLK
jgi:hypothetical protein